MMPGDVLLVASFISYVGCFTKQYRVRLSTLKLLNNSLTFSIYYKLDLLEKKWIPHLSLMKGKKIPMSLGELQPFYFGTSQCPGYAGANVLSLLTDDAIIAGWNNEVGSW